MFCADKNMGFWEELFLWHVVSVFYYMQPCYIYRSWCGEDMVELHVVGDRNRSTTLCNCVLRKVLVLCYGSIRPFAPSGICLSEWARLPLQMKDM